LWKIVRADKRGGLHNMKKGTFITFEGSEGSGKSTQIELARAYLESKGFSVLFVREPGGVKISEAIRNILLDAKNKEMSDAAETLLYMASRAQLVVEVLEPALKEGKVVLCDRFLDSTIAYQGYGHGVDLKFIKSVGTFATKGITPNLTFIFDIDAQTGLGRIKREKDRIELRALDYHERVRKGYLSLAKREPRRIKLISGSKDREEIQEFVRGHLNRLLKIQ
jgi:dTMP kinase